MFGPIIFGAGFACFTCAMFFAVAARRPARLRVRRKSFEAGVRIGRRAAPSDANAACAALQRSAPGRLVEVVEEAPDVILVAMERKRSQPCAFVAGALSGMFEAAWANTAVVEHTACAGRSGLCTYRVRRVVNPRGRPVGATSTPK